MEFALCLFYSLIPSEETHVTPFLPAESQFFYESLRKGWGNRIWSMCLRTWRLLQLVCHPNTVAASKKLWEQRVSCRSCSSAKNTNKNWQDKTTFWGFHWRWWSDLFQPLPSNSHSVGAWQWTSKIAQGHVSIFQATGDFAGIESWLSEVIPSCCEPFVCQGLLESGDKKTVVWIQRIHLQLTENKTNPVVPNWCPSHDLVSHIPDENALCPTGPHGVFFWGNGIFFSARTCRIWANQIWWTR